MTLNLWTFKGRLTAEIQSVSIFHTHTHTYSGPKSLAVKNLMNTYLSRRSQDFETNMFSEEVNKTYLRSSLSLYVDRHQYMKPVV